MEMKIERVRDVKMPRYVTPGDAAFDLCAAEEHVLKPGERKMIKTGIKMEIPEKHVALIQDRSGLAAHNGLHIMGGVIDETYRGEIHVVLKNLGEETFEVKKNMRIAQMLIQPIVNVDIVEGKVSNETHRGENRFGSTGLH